MARWHWLVPALLDFLKRNLQTNCVTANFCTPNTFFPLDRSAPQKWWWRILQNHFIFIPSICLSQGYEPHHRNHRGWLDEGYNRDFSLLTAGLIARIKMNGWWRISKSNYELFSHQPHFLPLYHSPCSPHHKEHTHTHTHAAGGKGHWHCCVCQHDVMLRDPDRRTVASSYFLCVGGQSS